MNQDSERKTGHKKNSIMILKAILLKTLLFPRRQLSKHSMLRIIQNLSHLIIHSKMYTNQKSNKNLK